MLTLRVTSGRLRFFDRLAISKRTILPLAIAQAMNIVLMNLSLANSSITFYQTTRILLTPAVALLNFIFYKKPISSFSAMMLLPVCLGVALLTCHESTNDIKNARSTTIKGIIYAFSGVITSAIMTVWISTYTTSLKLTSIQLLYNIAPISILVMTPVIPFLDTLPIFGNIPKPQWTAVFVVRVLSKSDPQNITNSFIVWLVCSCDKFDPIHHHREYRTCIFNHCRPYKDLFDSPIRLGYE